MAVVAAIGFFVIRISIDDRLLHQVLEFLLIPFATGLFFAALASRIRSLTFVLSACADFFCSVSQWWAVAATGLLLTYVAASTNLPLMDDVFARLDAMMGFRWADTYAWVQRHPMFQASLRAAYWSGGVQLLGLFLIHCMR